VKDVVAATGHTYGQWQPVQEATDLQPQIRERSCDVCGAVETGILEGETVWQVVRELPCEVVLTGRYPHPSWLEGADYVTRMEPLRHPHDRGIPAREGVEW